VKRLALLTVIALASCGGGGGSTPTSIPSISPTSVPLSLKQIAGAPLSATASQLSTTRRTAQAKTLSQGVENGLPVLVESSGQAATWAGSQTVWVTNTATGQDIAETGLTVTPSGTLAINNTAPEPLSCLGQTTAICAIHPTAWEFGTTSANGKPVGQQTITETFADGTTGSTFDDVYDGWNLPCNSGWAYVNGVPVAQSSEATSDVYADCVNQNIDFPKGGYVLANPTPDQYGLTITIMPTLLAAPIFIADTAVVPFASVAQGITFAIKTQDGGSAKVYFIAGAGVAGNAATGLSLHSQANGSFAF
jgi:hypothetical protein